jgi:hypothetical protein
MSMELANGGIGALLGGAVGWLLQKAFEYKLRQRLSQIESQLHIQSQWLAARLTRTDERRARTLSRLHTILDRALHLTEEYIGSNDAGNPQERVEGLRRAAILSWIEFDRSFSHAEIFLSAELAARIRNYGDAIADARVSFEQSRRDLDTGTDFDVRLAPLGRALGSLSNLRTDVRPLLVNEIRSALGANRLDH